MTDLVSRLTAIRIADLAGQAIPVTGTATGPGPRGEGSSIGRRLGHAGKLIGASVRHLRFTPPVRAARNARV